MVVPRKVSTSHWSGFAIQCAHFTLLVKGTSSSTAKCDAAKKMGAEKAVQSFIQNLIQMQMKEGTVTTFSALIHYVKL